MPHNTPSGFQDGFLEIVEEQLKLCQQEVRDLDQQIERKQQEIADLRAERGLAAKRAQQLEDVLGGQEPDDGQQAAPVPSPKPSKPLADADAVVELIQERGAMHYLDIHRTLVARGFEIGGEGKADTLLSRYFKDPRLVRVARGTYGFANQEAPETDEAESVDKSVRVRSMTFDPRPTRFEVPLPPVKLSRGMGLRDMAAEVLRQTDKPLHYRTITDQILNSGVWQPVTDTPEASVRSAMGIDIRDNGANSLFMFRRGTGIYSLREWEDDSQHVD